MPAAFLARFGVVVFAILFGMLLVTERPVDARAIVAGASTASASTASVSIASPGEGVADVPDVPVIAPPADEPAAAVAPPPLITEPMASPGGGDVVLASWYGPGFYGNRTACGQAYTPQLLGVANRTLACGTLVTLTFGARTVTVPVIDRGPYVAGRTLDLSAATRTALGCGDLCTVRMQLAR